VKNITLLQAIIAILVLALAVVWFMKPGPGKDGNPIGFDFVGGTGSVSATLTINSKCITNHTCKAAEVHYLTSPPPVCPTASTTPCTPPPPAPRSLAACPSNSVCLQFNNTTGTVDSQDKDGMHDQDSGVGGQAIVIVR
jgi:hypothetical protein